MRQSLLSTTATLSPSECPYCGRPLKAKTYHVNGKEFTVNIFGSCGCSEALAKLEGTHESPIRVDGMPELFAKAETTRADKVAEDVTNGDPVFIYGPNGSGKTHTACAALRLLAKKGKHCRFANSKEEVDRWFRDEERYYELVSRCVLCLDDLGKEGTSKWSVSAIFEVIDKRYRDKLPTIITSNYSVSEITSRYAQVGDRSTAQAIGSRLAEFKAYHLNDRDRRLA